MVKRAAAAAGQPAGGSIDSGGGTAVIDGRDALGNDRDEVQLEDSLLTEGGGTKAEVDAEAAGEEAQRKRLGLETFVDPRDALTAGFRKRRAAERGDETASAPEKRQAGAPIEVDEDAGDELDDGDQQDNGDAEPGEVVIIGKDGRVKATSGEEVRQADDTETEQPPARGTRAREAADPDAIPDSRIVSMVVDGVTVRMTHGEMRGIAQQNIAAAARLKEANRILDEARQVSRDSTSTRTDPGRRDQGDPASQETRRASNAQTERVALDPAAMKGLVSRIQLGDDDDAAAALAEAIQIGVEAGNARGQTNAGGGDVSSQVDEALALRAARSNVNQAIQIAAQGYGDVIGDDDYARSAYSRVHDKMLTNLRAIGVPEEDLHQPMERILEGYAKLQLDPCYGDRLAPLADVFVGSAEEVRQKFKLPARQVETRTGAPRLSGGNQQPTRIARTDGDRSGRKELVTSQPRSSSVRTDFSGNGSAPKKTAPSDVVANMAAARGQYTGIRTQ